MNHGLLVGAGFLAGTLGMKALKSQPVHDACVKAIVGGMQLKESAESMVDEAKAEFDDLMAEAGYERAAETDEDAKALDGETAPAEDSAEEK